MTPNCAIYCRLSREDREKTGESESIHNQRELLRAYAAHQGWRVVREYVDEDYSGADSQRPAFLQMIEDARLGRVDLILCKSQSRFTRDLELVERYLHGLFPRWGVRFVAVADQVDTARQGGRKARQISGLVNQWYLEDLSDSIRAVLAHKQASGQFIGSTAPYGYEKCPGQKGRLQVCRQQAPVVLQMYRWAAEGWGKAKIAAALTRRGIPAPAGGPVWNEATVGRILHSEVYLGAVVQGKRRRASYKEKKLLSVPREQWQRVPGRHPAIVPQELLDQVQQQMRGRTRSGGAGKRHPLAGKAVCGLCGAPLAKRRSGGHDYLFCRCRKGVSVRLDRLEEELRCRLAAYGRQTAAGSREEALRQKQRQALSCWKRQLRQGLLQEEEYRRLAGRLERMSPPAGPAAGQEAWAGLRRLALFPYGGGEQRVAVWWDFSRPERQNA